MSNSRMFIPRAGNLCLAVLLLFSLTQASALPRSVQAAFYPEILAQMDAAINEAIASNKCPGGVLWLEHRGAAYHLSLIHI